MGKPSNKKRLAENEAMAYGKFIRVSPRKLNLVAAMIRGKKAERALIDLDFTRKACASDVRGVLASAIANAENNFGLNVDRLIVKEAHVGTTLVMKRFHTRGRGRSARVEKPFSNLTIVVQEVAPKPKAEKAAKAQPKSKKAEG